MSRSASLTYKGAHIARVEVANASGQASLDGGRIIFNCRMLVSAQPERRVRFLDATGELWLKASPVHIGRLTAFNALHGETGPEADETSFTVFAHLNSRELMDLERLRLEGGSGGLGVEVRLSVAMYGPPGPYSGQAWMSYMISQSEWTDCLRSTRFESRVLIEIPTQGGRVGGALATAAEHYQQALSLQRQGNWRQVVGECRSVAEELRNALNLHSPPAAEWGQQAQKRQWDLRQRVEHARAAIHHICHLANHAGTQDDPTAEDARLVIALVGSLLRYYAERTAK